MKRTTAPALYADRKDAARALLRMLAEFKGADPLVLAIPACTLESSRDPDDGPAGIARAACMGGNRIEHRPILRPARAGHATRPV